MNTKAELHRREVAFRGAVLKYEKEAGTLDLVRLDTLVRHWQRDIDEAVETAVRERDEARRLLRDVDTHDTLGGRICGIDRRIAAYLKKHDGGKP